MKLKIKTGSTVEVITGSDKGKKGVVLDVDPIGMRLKIEGVRVQTKHTKNDGLKKMEGYIHYSNAKLVESVAKKKSASKSAR